MDARARKKLFLGILSFALVGGVLAYVLSTTAASAFEYYKHVDEVAPSMAEWQHKPMQLHGFVLPGSTKKRLDRDRQRLEYKFVEVNCGKEIEVHYAGTVPDTFKDGAEVVVKGTLRGQEFQATEVMAKCPSKYQASETHNTLCTRGKALNP